MTARRRHGSVVWLIGGPSAGKSSIASAIQREGGAAEAWLLAGDMHLLRTLDAPALIRRPPVDDGEWPGWTVPFDGTQVVGRPRAGSTARRLLDGMYRAVAASAGAGNNVVLEDVIWELDVGLAGLEVLEAVNPLIVEVTCRHEIAIERERSRADRFVGSVDADASQPRAPITASLTVDTTQDTPEVCAAAILATVRS